MEGKINQRRSIVALLIGLRHQNICQTRGFRSLPTFHDFRIM
jgi:hypothetical protein